MDHGEKLIRTNFDETTNKGQHMLYFLFPFSCLHFAFLYFPAHVIHTDFFLPCMVYNILLTNVKYPYCTQLTHSYFQVYT